MLCGNKLFLSYFTHNNSLNIFSPIPNCTVQGRDNNMCRTNNKNHTRSTLSSSESLRSISNEINKHEYATEDYLFLKYRISNFPKIDEHSSDDDISCLSSSSQTKTRCLSYLSYEISEFDSVMFDIINNIICQIEYDIQESEL